MEVTWYGRKSSYFWGRRKFKYTRERYRMDSLTAYALIFINYFIPLFHKYLLEGLYVLGLVLSSRETNFQVNSLSSWNLQSV
jgi:hypothetical protein